jgi:hypothetical protein
MNQDNHVLANIDEAIRIMSAASGSKGADRINAILTRAKNYIASLHREKARSLTARDTVALAMVPHVIGDFSKEEVMAEAFLLADAFLLASNINVEGL